MYIEYHELLKKYKEADNKFIEALDKRSKLLYSVTPHAVQPKEIVNHISNTSPDANMIRYASEIEEIDNLINMSRNNRDMLKYELEKKEIEIKNSSDVLDKIYVYKWIDHISVYKITKMINYSKRQTYRFVDEIKKNLYKK